MFPRSGFSAATTGEKEIDPLRSAKVVIASDNYIVKKI